MKKNTDTNTGDKKLFRHRLKYQFMALILIGLILPVSAVLLYQISLASENNKRNSMDDTMRMAEQISQVLETMNRVLYDISDTYVNNEAVQRLLARNYSGNPNLKRITMTYLKNISMGRSAFSDVLGVSAIYTRHGELMNFYTNRLSPRRDDFYDPIAPERLEWLKQFQIDAPEKLGILHWYSLQPNYFQEQETGDPRWDYILLGSRRTFNLFHGSYRNTHLFIIPEQSIFEQYQKYLWAEGQQIFILDGNKKLISSSDIGYLTGLQLNEALLSRLQPEAGQSFSLVLDGVEKLVSFHYSDDTGWYSVVITPAAAVTRPFWVIFRNVMLAMIILLCLFFAGIVVFSRYISVPLKELVNSMMRVEKGDFSPAPSNRYHNEIGHITYYHNHMVRQLERLINEKYEREKKSRELEARVLMGQINPHFMYNTLDTIVWKARQAEHPEIAEVTIRLGQFLRTSVKNGTTMTLLSQEIQQTLLYIEIQQVRFKERMHFEILPFAEQLADFRVLSLILQPAVENALVHGMYPGDIPIKIVVEITREENCLRIGVSDNGRGMDAGRLKTVTDHISGKIGAEIIKASHTGIGMRNIQERISLYFGADYGLEITSAPDAGTTVWIRLPLLSPDEDHEDWL